MRNILILSLALLSIFSSSFAVDRIYSIGCTTAIVADDKDWSCAVSSGQNHLVKGTTTYIQGASTHFPLSFTFYEGHLGGWRGIEKFLKDLAVKTNTMLSNVTLKDINGGTVAECEFYNGVRTGYIHILDKTFEGKHFVMVSRIDSYPLGESERENLYQSAHDLITPLYNPKALALWLESVESRGSEK